MASSSSGNGDKVKEEFELLDIDDFDVNKFGGGVRGGGVGGSKNDTFFTFSSLLFVLWERMGWTNRGT